MIVEERIYTLQIGAMGKFIEYYVKDGKDVQVDILGMPLGWYMTEAGPLNQFIHLWGYDSFEDRLARRKRLFENETFQVYIRNITPLLITQESKILLPAPFFTPETVKS